MTRASAHPSRTRRRHHPRSVLPRARSIARRILATPAWSRAVDGKVMVSLPMAAAIGAAEILGAIALLELATVLITGKRL